MRKTRLLIYVALLASLCCTLVRAADAEITDPTQMFVISLPPGWKGMTDGGSFQIVHPDHEAAFTSTVYQKPKESFDAFSRIRFSLVKASFPRLVQQPGVEDLSGSGWVGKIQEYAGAMTSDKSDKDQYRYLVFVGQSGNRFLSLTLVTSAEEFAKHEALYRNAFKTIQLLKKS